MFGYRHIASMVFSTKLLGLSQSCFLSSNGRSHCCTSGGISCRVLKRPIPGSSIRLFVPGQFIEQGRDSTWTVRYHVWHLSLYPSVWCNFFPFYLSKLQCGSRFGGKISFCWVCNELLCWSLDSNEKWNACLFKKKKKARILLSYLKETLNLLIFVLFDLGCAKASTDYKWLTSDTSIISVSPYGIMKAKRPGIATVKVVSTIEPQNFDEVTHTLFIFPNQLVSHSFCYLWITMLIV